MSLIIGDPHGNYGKVKSFIDYKPEEEHIIVGDFLDSFSASNEDILSTFKLAIDSDVTLLAGNHELPYLPNAHRFFKCSGNRTAPELFHFVASYKDKLSAAVVRDGFLITHGGLSKKHGKPFINVYEAEEWINKEWVDYRDCPMTPNGGLSPIFDIGGVRCGPHEVSGIFWLTFNQESYDKRFDQVVGHTCAKTLRINDNGRGWNNTIHVCVDTPLYHCFNTKTKIVEDFMPEAYKGNDQMRNVIERVF